MTRPPSDLADQPAYPPGIAVFNTVSKLGQPQVQIQQHHGRLTMLDAFGLAVAPAVLKIHCETERYLDDEEACLAVWNLARKLLAARPKPPEPEDQADPELDGRPGPGLVG